MSLRRCKSILPIAAALFLAAPHAVQACPVCFGDPDSPLTHGARQGILTMLILTYSVLIGMFGMLALVVVCARRRQKFAALSGQGSLQELQIDAPPDGKELDRTNPE